MAADGEVAHILAEDYFKFGIDPASRLGQATKRGPITEDHVRGVQAFIRAVNDRWDGLSPRMAETRVDIPGLQSKGRIDLKYQQADGLWIWDYKHGRTWVDAVENWQLLCYAVGALEHYSVPGAIHLCICQPNSFDPDGPVKVWTLTPGEFVIYRGRLLAAIAATKDPEPRTTPGPHCLWCSGRGACRALGAAVAAVFDYLTGAEYVPASGAAVGLELSILDQAADLIKARRSGLEADALARSRKGEPIVGWEVVPKMSNLNWTVPLSQAADLADLAGVNIRKEALLTPLQAMAAGVPAEIVEAVSGRESYGFGLKKSKSPEVFFNG
jgi:hypothetical protein